jgi:hypothetical protein
MNREIITFKVQEKHLFHIFWGDCTVLEAKKTTFLSRFKLI